MVFQRLLAEQDDCARLVFTHLTRRQALLVSQVCKQARAIALGLLQQDPSPFRKAMVVACSQPGRLIEVDTLQDPGWQDPRSMMWNAAAPSWRFCQQARKKRRRPFLTCRRPPRPAEPWMTGLTAGPADWERVRRQAAALAEAAGADAVAASSQESPTTSRPPTTSLTTPPTTSLTTPPTKSLLDPLSNDTAVCCSSSFSPDDEAAAAGPSSGPSFQPPWPALPHLRPDLRYRPTGPTLYASCYAVPGIVAFDGTTLLPLGVLVRFGPGSSLECPEGLCASGSHLFVLGMEDCTVARIGLQQPSDLRSGATVAVQRYGGYLSYGRGVVLARISAGSGWIGWGMALAPDGSGLYCAVDLPFAVGRKQYTEVPPPSTSGNVLVVPMECLAGGSTRGASATELAGGMGGPGPRQEVAAVAALPLAAVAALPAPPQQPEAPLVAGANLSGAGDPGPSAAPEPYCFLRGPPVLRRPSGLCFSPDGRTLWVTSFDTGLVQVAGPACGPAAGVVLRVVTLPAVTPLTQPSPRRSGGARTGSRAATTGPGSRGDGSHGGGGGGRMLAWDLCWVPQAPPDTSPTAVQSNGDNSSGGCPVGVHSRSRPPPLLCATLHEDASPGMNKDSGAECRVGRVLEPRELQEPKGGGQGMEDSVEEGSSEGVQVVARWRSDRRHSHPSMVCVC